MRTKKQEKNGPESEARMSSVQRGHCGSPFGAHWACRRTAPHVRGEETALTGEAQMGAGHRTARLVGKSDSRSVALCHAMDCNPPGSAVHGILQARMPEWVAMSFSRGCS